MTYHFTQTISQQTINGTQFPVTVMVYGSNRQYTVATVCNGTASSAKDFRTKREAISYAEELVANA